MNKLLSASRLLELYTDNSDGYQSTADKLLSNLFDGFIFYVAVVVFIISVLVITAKYRRKPTLGKRKSLTATTVLLTVFDSLLLLFKVDFFRLLCNPYDYFTSYNFSSFTPGTSEYAIYVSYYIVVIATVIAGIIVCIVGYTTLSDKELKKKAFDKATALQQQYTQYYQAPPQGMQQPQYNTWQCNVCGMVNKDIGGDFCSQCGAKKNVPSGNPNGQ